MASTSFTYSSTTETAEVTGDHFGLNILFDQDDLDPGSDYSEVESAVVNNTIRYPGGTLAEAFFDPANPNATTGTHAFETKTNGDPIFQTGQTPLSDMLQYAADNGVQLIIVIPTWRYFDETLPGSGFISQSDKAVISDFVEAVLTDPLVTSGQVEIAGFEIGNEYYQGQFTWTASQFGELSSQIAMAIEDGIDTADNGQDPMTFVQAGQTPDDIDDIRNEFEGSEIDLVDGVIRHFYVTNSQGNPMNTGSGVEARLDEIYDVWGADMPVLVSEWNVGGDGPNNTPLSGLMRNAPLMRTFAEMVENGVDIATFWSVIAGGEDGTATLSRQSDGPHLTPTGYLYRMLSENVIGTDLQTQNTSFKLPGGQGYAMVFEGDGKTVIYFVSGTDEQLDIDADLSGLIDANSHMYATRLSSVGSDPTLYLAEGKLTHLTEADLDPTAGSLDIELGAYELIQIVITDQSYGEGLTLYGDDQNETNDSLVGSDAADLLSGHDGADTLLGEGGGDTLDGGAGSDSLKGFGGSDVLRGRSENDEISGDNGNDTLFGGAGEDTLTGGGGDDSLLGGSNSDVMTGSAGNDTALGEVGNDTITGNDGNDALFGGDGDDSINGNDDNDTLLGENGQDTLTGGNGADTLEGGAHDDVLTASNGSDLAKGDAGHDAVNGNDGADTLFGGSGDDTLKGGDGSDKLHGGTGDDRLVGGAGQDTFVFRKGWGNDKVVDFGLVNDELELDDTLWSGTLTEAQVVSAFATVSNGNVVFDFGDGDTLTLVGVSSLSGLDALIDIV